MSLTVGQLELLLSALVLYFFSRLRRAPRGSSSEMHAWVCKYDYFLSSLLVDVAGVEWG